MLHGVYRRRLTKIRQENSAQRRRVPLRMQKYRRISPLSVSAEYMRSIRSTSCQSQPDVTKTQLKIKEEERTVTHQLKTHHQTNASLQIQQITMKSTTKRCSAYVGKGTVFKTIPPRAPKISCSILFHGTGTARTDKFMHGARPDVEHLGKGEGRRKKVKLASNEKYFFSISIRVKTSQKVGKRGNYDESRQRS